MKRRRRRSFNNLASRLTCANSLSKEKGKEEKEEEEEEEGSRIWRRRKSTDVVKMLMRIKDAILSSHIVRHC